MINGGISMDARTIGMIISSLKEQENNKNPHFHDHKRIILTLISSLSFKYKKDSILSILCDVYNDGIEDNTSNSIKHYLTHKDLHESTLKDISSNDCEILIRVIPLVFYFAYHKYIDDNKRYSMITEITKLTHSHPISVISSIIYSSLLLSLIENKVMDDEIEKVFNYLKEDLEYRDWLNQFVKFIHVDRIKVLHREDVSNSTYVLDTLTLSLWSVLTSYDYNSAIDRIKEITSNTTIIILAAALAGAKYSIDNNTKDKYIEEIKYLKEIIKNYNEF